MVVDIYLQLPKGDITVVPAARASVTTVLTTPCPCLREDGEVDR